MKDRIYFNSPITHETNFVLRQMLESGVSSDDVTIMLVTEEGDYNCAYQMAKMLRKHYEYVRVLLPSRCKGAGMLITAIANELAFDTFGELGPVSTGSQVEAGKNEMLEHYFTMLQEFAFNFRDHAIGRLVAGYPTEHYAIDLREAKKLFFGIDEATEADREWIKSIDNGFVQPIHGNGARIDFYPEGPTASIGLYTSSGSRGGMYIVETESGPRTVEVIHVGRR